MFPPRVERLTEEISGRSKLEAVQETGNLIAADKVQGTYVYNKLGEELGSIHDVMIDKSSGKIAYAIMSFGGFFGIGNQYHPLPWAVLKYDTTKGGYVVHLDKSQLESGPAYDVDKEPDWNDRAYETKVHDYYGVGPYWEL
jgi:PRC-barrel domain